MAASHVRSSTRPVGRREGDDCGRGSNEASRIHRKRLRKRRTSELERTWWIECRTERRSGRVGHGPPTARPRTPLRPSKGAPGCSRARHWCRLLFQLLTHGAQEPDMDTHLTETGQSRETTGASVIALDDATWVFVQARPGLLTLARHILGNAHEAEDVIQETWLRWQDVDRTAVSNAPALLRTTTVRLAINVVQSAWKRRESCDSPSLPERVDHHAGPEEVAERQDAVERAVLLLMETLTPRQRAAYVLREGFGCPYDRIAEILHLSV